MSTLSHTITLPTRISEEDFVDIAGQAFDYIVEQTPVDTGYCAEQWQEPELDYPSFTLFCDCEYSSYLDDGWSQQAPDGMTRPTDDFVRRLVNGY